jgi:hypothetical protein
MRSLYILVVVFLSGCTGYQYIASPAYVPLNTKKGDLKANLSYAYAQVGYTVSDHFSLFATGYRRRGGTFINFESWGTKEGGGANEYKDHSAEINAGGSYFTTHKNFNYEVHIGGGAGEVYYWHKKDVELNYEVTLNARKGNAFIQPSLSYTLPLRRIQDYLQFGAFTKFTACKYYDLDVYRNITSGPADPEDAYFMNRDYRDLYFVEPGICVRGGSKWVKGNAIVSAPINTTGNTIRERPLNLYLSLFLNFNLLRKKEE